MPVQQSAAAQGQVLHLMGVIRSGRILFRDNTIYDFEVDARVTARVRMTDEDNAEVAEHDPGSFQADACVLARAALKMEGDPRGDLPLAEFMSMVIPPSQVTMTPDFDAMEVEEGLMDPLEPSEKQPN